jgi:hypothetical protein
VLAASPGASPTSCRVRAREGGANNGPVTSPGPGGLFSNTTTGTVPVAWFGAYRNGTGAAETLHVFVICSAP